MSDPAVRQAFERLAQLLPSYRPREAQVRMAEAVTQALRAARHGAEIAECDGASKVIVAAGTGTGKTAAYTLPAVALAKASGKKVLVCSSTVALQHQLVEHDLPLFQRASAVPFTFALAKGRGRYVCAMRLERAVGTVAQGRLIDDGERAPEGAALQTLVTLSRALAAGRWNGDRDLWPDGLDDPIWERVSTDRNGCSGKSCPRFGDCAFYAARQQIRSADVVIANHALLLAGLEMPAGSVLPDPAQCFVVIDEAHALVDAVVTQWRRRHSLGGAAEWLSKVVECAANVVLSLRLPGAPASAVADASRLAAAALHELDREARRVRRRPGGVHRFRHGALPEQMQACGATLRSKARCLYEALHDLRARALASAPSAAELAQRLIGDIGFYLSRLDNLIDTWDLMLDPCVVGRPRPARWLEFVDDDVYACAAPLNAGARLRRLLWSRASAAVVCSATLKSCGTFTPFLRESGLDAYPAVSVLDLPSPFDYASCGTLDIAPMRSDPRNQSAHTREIAARLPELLCARGVLVVFSSRRAMRDVHDSLDASLRAKVLMQGQYSKAEILRRHRAVIEDGGTSVIFGLASWTEGVDMRGALCEQVIIARLNFQVPVDPITAAKTEWIERNGGSGFRDVLLPRAAVRLQQAVGRLIRSETDTGTITILDRRLATRDYGAVLMRGLPAFRRRGLTTAAEPAAEAGTQGP